MSIAKHNKGTTIDWNVKTDNFNYVRLSDLDEKRTYTVYGMFITKDKGYGEGAVLILKDCYVNIPARYIDTCREIMEDAETVSEIKDGKCGFYYEKMETEKSKKFNRKAYIVEFVDL